MRSFAQAIRVAVSLTMLAAGTPLMAAEQPVSDQPAPTLLAQVPAQPAMPQLPPAASSATAAVPAGMQGTISLDLRNIDVVDALKFLAMKGGINIITSKAVTGRVTLMVTAAPIQDVFDLMLRSNNLAYDRQGDIYSVMTQEEYRALYGRSFSDVRQVKAFSLNYTVPKRAYDMLEALKSEIGRVIVDEETGNVLLLDAPQQLEMLSEALKNFEDKNAVKVIKLNYAKAKDIEEVLKKQVDVMGLAGSIKADERGNNIIVQTLPERMQQFEELVRSLDQKTKEIIIDTNIVQVVLRDEVNTGIEWEGLFDAARTAGGFGYVGAVPFSAVQSSSDAWKSRLQTWQDVGYVGSYPSSGYTSNYSAGRRSLGLEELHLGLVGKHDVDFILRYLQQKGNTKIMSNPKIVVVHNQEAKIHVGQQEAYVTTTTTAGQTTNTISEQVNFVDTGVILAVTPDINDDGFINLKVSAEVNSKTDTYVTPTNNRIPIIDKSKAETTVLVKDGTTVVIGGLRKESVVKTSSQTPLLGSIPLLGHLFKQTSNNTVKTELLIIMTPRLISGEVFVSGSDAATVSSIALKPLKPYQNSRRETGETAADAVYMPAEPKKLEMKGLRK